MQLRSPIFKGGLLSIDFVSDNPKLNFRTNELFNTFETVTLVPANYTWMSCSAANDRYVHCQMCSGQSTHTRAAVLHHVFHGSLEFSIIPTIIPIFP